MTLFLLFVSLVAFVGTARMSFVVGARTSLHWALRWVAIALIEVVWIWGGSIFLMYFFSQPNLEEDYWLFLVGFGWIAGILGLLAGFIVGITLTSKASEEPYRVVTLIPSDEE